MTQTEADNIIAKIAKKHKVSPLFVRSQIQSAIQQAQSSANPQVQARWATVSGHGSEITVEEFLEYCKKEICK